MALEHNKYLFDLNNFDTGAGANPEEPPPPMFSEEELAAARQAGFNEGLKKGLADGLASRDQQIVALTQKLTADMATLIGAEAARAKRFETELIELVTGSFTKMFPILNAHVGLSQIVDTISKILADTGDTSTVVIESAPTDYDDLHARLRPFLSQHEGQVTVLPQSDIEPGSFRMRWKDGGAIRDTRALSEQIIDAIGRTLAESAQKEQN